MKIVYVYCEGPTEESFVNSVLKTYLGPKDVFVFPILCTTSRKHGVVYKGGATAYGKIKYDLSNLCKQHKNACVTTIFDYYGLPKDTPGLQVNEIDLYKKIEHIEKAIEDDIGLRNLHFYLSVHEFESLLFSDPATFGLITDAKTVQEIEAIRSKFPNPEFINNSFETAPSKRIIGLISYYSKVMHGTMIANTIGIETMRKECPHFNKWIESILDS